LSHTAAVTDTIKLGTSVVNALLQPPVLLAKRRCRTARLQLPTGAARRRIAVLDGWMYSPCHDFVRLRSHPNRTAQAPARVNVRWVTPLGEEVASTR
jgi:hypothetical protein